MRRVWACAAFLFACQQGGSQQPAPGPAVCATAEVRCDQSGFCPAGTHCAGTSCQGGCVHDADCPFSQKCTGGSCGCPTGQHLCGTACVAADNPAACGDSCSVCPKVANGAAACIAGQCAVACRPGFAICNGACVNRATMPASFSVSVVDARRGPDIEVGDFTGDGIPDLAVSSSDGLFFLRGRGDGTFVVPQTGLKDPNLTGQMTAARLGNSGASSLIVSRIQDGGFTVLQAGASEFSEGASWALPSIPLTGFVFSDLNDDGIADVIFGDVDPSIGVSALGIVAGGGDGSFVAAKRLLRLWAGPEALAIGDFDGDGAADIAVVDFNELAVYFGKGGGAFSDPVLVPNIVSTHALPDGLIAADVDHDGHPDLIVHSTDGRIRVLLARSRRRFIAAPSFDTLFGALQDRRGIVFGNFEGSGFDDLAISTTSGVVIFRSTALGWKQVATVPMLGAGIGSALRVADLNGDGWPDLIGTDVDGQVLTALGICSP